MVYIYIDNYVCLKLYLDILFVVGFGTAEYNRYGVISKYFVYC